MVEAIQHAHGYHAANPDVAMSLLLNADARRALGLAEGCPWLTDVYAVSLAELGAQGQAAPSLRAVPQTWDYVIFGLSAALYGEITLEGGRVQQSTFKDYPVVRMNESPAIEVYLVPSTEQPGGIGEPGTALIGPAVANAVFQATGRRVRRLPLRPEWVKA